MSNGAQFTAALDAALALSKLPHTQRTPTLARRVLGDAFSDSHPALMEMLTDTRLDRETFQTIVTCARLKSSGTATSAIDADTRVQDALADRYIPGGSKAMRHAVSEARGTR